MEPMNYASVLQHVRDAPGQWFGFETPDDKDVWCYIIAASGHLEDWAAYLLWEYDGRTLEGQPCELEQYLEWANLRTLYVRLEKINVLTPSVLRTLREINRLRNGVAHRHGTHGVTEPETPLGRPMGMYRDGQVFGERRALRTLVEDEREAAQALVAIAHRLRKRNEQSTPPSR